MTVSPAADALRMSRPFDHHEHGAVRVALVKEHLTRGGETAATDLGETGDLRGVELGEHRAAPLGCF